MRLSGGLIMALGGVLLLGAGPALAGEAYVGVYAHDIDDRISQENYEQGPQIVLGARTTSLDELAWLGRPRAHLLAGLNTRGGTNYLAAGLAWRFRVADRFYVQPGVGVAVHDGKINLPSPNEPGIGLAEQRRRLDDWRTRLDLGSRVTFEPEISFGYRANDRLSLELSWIHLSHAQLAGKQNPGLGDLGLRAVYRYGLDRGQGPRN